MIYDLFKGLAFLGKHLWPFIREWLFKSRSFKDWLKVHATQLFYFFLICLMMFVCYHLFLAATEAHKQRNIAYGERERAIKRYNDLKAAVGVDSLDIQQLRIAAKAAADQNRQQLITIETYQQWMRSCGMNYEDLQAVPYPTCTKKGDRNVQPRSSARSTKKSKPQTQKQQPRPKPGDDLQRQVQDLWGD